VRESRAPGFAVGVLPVRETGERGADGAHDADEDRIVGAPARGALPWPSAAAGIERVEDERGRPGAEGHVGEGGMQRVAEPRAVQEILHGSAGVPAGLEGGCDRPLQGVLDRGHPLLSFDPLRCALGEPGQPRVTHRQFLLAGALDLGWGRVVGLAAGAVSASLRAS
jgi:hypothetical protein